MNVFGKGLLLWSFFRNPHKVVRGLPSLCCFAAVPAVLGMAGGMSEAGTKGREGFGAEEVQERGGPSPGLAALVDVWMQRIEEDARADMRQAGAVDRKRRKWNGAR